MAIHSFPAWDAGKRLLEFQKIGFEIFVGYTGDKYCHQQAEWVQQPIRGLSKEQEEVEYQYNANGMIHI